MSQPAIDCLSSLPRGLRIVTGRLSFTLVELLIATAIAGLLLAVVLAVYGTLLNTVALQNRWRERIMPGADAMDVIARDLACAVIPFGVTNRPFTAITAGQPEEIFKMSFYSAFPARSETSGQGEASKRGVEASGGAELSDDWRGYSVGQVSYCLRGAGVTDEFTLVRESRPFRVPARSRMSSGLERWRGIKKLDIVFFNGAAWTNQWGSGNDTNLLPQAVRISMLTGQNDAREIGVEVIVNAGRQVTPEKQIQSNKP